MKLIYLINSPLFRLPRRKRHPIAAPIGRPRHEDDDDVTARAPATSPAARRPPEPHHEPPTSQP